MGSRGHTAGVGFSPRLIGQRTLSSLFEAESQRRADLRPVRYYAHLGGTIHLVQDLCNDLVFRVSGPPDLSFARGAVVPAGSFNGLQGEFLTGFPAMGQSGGSVVPQALSVRSTGLRVKGPCPTVPLGKSYLGIFVDFAATPDRLYAFRYTDGSYQSVAGFVDLPAGVAVPSFSGNPIQRVHTQGDVILLNAHKAGGECILTWNVTAGTLKVAETGISSGDMGGPIWPGSGGFVFFADIFSAAGEQHIQLYKIAIGHDGAVDLPGSVVGPEFIEASGDLSCPNVLYASGADFQVPSFYFAGGDPDQIAVPFSNGAAWALGDGREILSPSQNVNGYGYPASDGRVIRITNFEASGNETLGLLPKGPGTPEVSLFPPEWQLTGLGHLAINPAKTEAVCYPVEISGEPVTGDRMTRVPIQAQAFNGACVFPFITVEPATPVGELPAVMLARD